MDSKAFDRLCAAPNYLEILRVLINGTREWKLNNEGHVMHFKEKHLAYIPKVWHHFITSHLILTTNVCEVTTKRALLNFAFLQDIPFDVGQVIEDAILYNRDAKMNLGHPFLIFRPCKNDKVTLEDNEAWIHPIKATSVKKDKPGVPRPEEVYDSDNERSNEEELRAYQTRFGIQDDALGEVGQSSTVPLPPPPHSHKEPPPSPTSTLEDQVHELTARFDAFWDETQEHQVSIIQDVDVLWADMATVLRNQVVLLHNQEAIQQ